MHCSQSSIGLEGVGTPETENPGMGPEGMVQARTVLAGSGSPLLHAKLSTLWREAACLLACLPLGWGQS